MNLYETMCVTFNLHMLNLYYTNLDVYQFLIANLLLLSILTSIKLSVRLGLRINYIHFKFQKY